jgi:hypothetical protein
MTSSVRSVCSRPKRRSGLSLPKRAIDSSKRMRGKRPVGVELGEVDAEHSFQSAKTSPSIIAKMSSWLTKDISTSIWVNSGWRSRRRSSSRKHFTIWKYRSKPATM